VLDRALGLQGGKWLDEKVLGQDMGLYASGQAPSDAAQVQAGANASSSQASPD
jgi:hypothetical protein